MLLEWIFPVAIVVTLLVLLQLQRSNQGMWSVQWTPQMILTGSIASLALASVEIALFVDAGEPVNLVLAVAAVGATLWLWREAWNRSRGAR